MGHHSVQAKNPIVGRHAALPNDPLYIIQEKQWVIDHTTHAAYLDQLVDRQAGPSSVPVFPGQLAQPIDGPPPVAPTTVGQPSDFVPPLLSLRLQPGLNALARTLSPQALRYVHLGIQIGQESIKLNYNE